MENCVHFERDEFHLHCGLIWWFYKGIFLIPVFFFSEDIFLCSLGKILIQYFENHPGYLVF